MSEPFVGEIRMFAGNFTPRGWASCEGQLLAVSQNDDLFSLLGTIYGGDGRTTFGLPDLRGRVPIHMGTGSGLSNRRLGAKLGEEKVTLATANLPVHNHLLASTSAAGAGDPGGNVLGDTGDDLVYGSPAMGAPAGDLHPDASVNRGGSQSHNNLMPYLVIRFIIATVGIYPSES